MIEHTLISEHFALSDLQREQFAALFELYSDWNSRINVISRKDMANFYLRHVLHSLSISKLGVFEAGQRVLDIGCGGGFPLVPLAIMHPDVEWLGVDSIGKKIRVVDGVVGSLGLQNVRTRNCRVESIDEHWDWVVSRAVAPLADLMAWSRGRWTEGMLLLKGGDLSEEIHAANPNGYTVDYQPISQWFSDSFFDTKGVLVIKKQK